MSKQTKIYITTFDTQRNRVYRNICYVGYADNAKEAVALARFIWEQNRPEHMFHLHAVKSRCQDPKYMSVRSYKNTMYEGEDCFDKFIVLDARPATWG